MFCKQCGSMIPDGSKFCLKCGAPVEPVSTEELIPSAQPVSPAPQPDDNPDVPTTSVQVCPPDYLAKAIVYTCIFCNPFGIPAIVNASKVKRAFRSGDYELAVRRSVNAQRWCKTTLVVGIILWILIIAFICLIYVGLLYLL